MFQLLYSHHTALLTSPTDPTQRLLAGVLGRAFPGLTVANAPEPSSPPDADDPNSTPGTIAAVFVKDEGTRATTALLTTLRAHHPDAMLCVSGPSLPLARRRRLTDAGADAFCDLSVVGDMGRAIDLTQRALELSSVEGLSPTLRRTALHALAAKRDPLHAAA